MITSVPMQGTCIHGFHCLVQVNSTKMVVDSWFTNSIFKQKLLFSILLSILFYNVSTHYIALDVSEGCHTSVHPYTIHMIMSFTQFCPVLPSITRLKPGLNHFAGKTGFARAKVQPCLWVMNYPVDTNYDFVIHGIIWVSKLYGNQLRIHFWKRVKLAIGYNTPTCVLNFNKHLSINYCFDPPIMLITMHYLFAGHYVKLEGLFWIKVHYEGAQRPSKVPR